MPTTAITEAITTLAEAERRFNLTSTEDEQFACCLLPASTGQFLTALQDLSNRGTRVGESRILVNSDRFSSSVFTPAKVA